MGASNSPPESENTTKVTKVTSFPDEEKVVKLNARKIDDDKIFRTSALKVKTEITFYYYKFMHDTYLRILRITSAKEFCQLYIFIIRIPDMISFIKRTLPSVITAVFPLKKKQYKTLCWDDD